MAAYQPLIYSSQHRHGIAQLIQLLLDSIKSLFNIQLHTAAPVSERIHPRLYVLKLYLNMQINELFSSKGVDNGFP